MDTVWHRHHTDREVAKAIRKDQRLFRREKGKGGHRFVFKDLKSLYYMNGEGAEHVVLSHHEDPAWIWFWRHPDKGWMQQEAYPTKGAAQEAAEAFVTPNASPALEPGTYVTAGWPGRDHTMRVRCRTSWTQQQIIEIFAKLGCEVNREVIAAAG